mmetsp:Transcript_9273/g.19179  ORF Transcript_9273/g.19179 Transcript_9273/m.19179 type:complete len:1151 (+) Transcript_9273:490-3942(+)
MSLFLSRPSASKTESSSRQHKKDASLDRALKTLSSTPMKSPVALSPRQSCNLQRRRKSLKLEDVVKEKDNQLRALQEKFHNCKLDKENQVQTLQNHLNKYMASAEKLSQKKGADASIMDIVRHLEEEHSLETFDFDSESENDGIEKELKIRVENANKIIASLEHQVDDLTSQKNDALDWIEELFAKAEIRDKKMKQIIEERNKALTECETLRNANVKTEGMLNCAISDLEQERRNNEQLKSENHVTITKSKSLEEELAAALEKMRCLTEESSGEMEEQNGRSKTIANEECKARVDELESTLEQERENHRDTKNQLQRVKMEVEKSNAQMDSNREELNSVLAECETLRNAVAKTEGLYHCAISDLEQTRKDNDQLKSENLDMVTKLKSLGEEFAADMEKVLSFTRESSDRLKITADEFEAKIEEFNISLEDVKEQHLDTKNQLGGIHTEIQETNGQGARNCDTRNSALNECEKLLNIAARAEGLHHCAISEIEQTRKENGQLKSENLSMLTKVKLLEEELSTAVHKAEWFNRELSGTLDGRFEEVGITFCNSTVAKMEELRKALEKEKNDHEITQKLLKQVRAEHAELIAQERDTSNLNIWLRSEIKQLHTENSRLAECTCKVELYGEKSSSNDFLLAEQSERTEAEFEDLKNKYDKYVEQSKEAQERFCKMESRYEALSNELENEKKKVTELNEENELLKTKMADQAFDAVIRDKSLLGRRRRGEDDLANMNLENDRVVKRFESEKKPLTKEKDKVHRVVHEMQSKRNPVVSFVPSKSSRYSSLGVSDLTLELEQIARKCDKLKSENLRLKAERRHLCDKIQRDGDNEMCFDNLRSESNVIVEKLQSQIQRANDDLIKSENVRRHLLTQIDAKDAMISEAEVKMKRLLVELDEVRRSNSDRARNEHELRDAVARSQSLLRDLTSEYSELKEKNDSFQRTSMHLEKQSNELEGLLSSALTERDTASDEVTRLRQMYEELEAANENLKSDLKSLSNLRDSALYDREMMRLKHDKLIADCNADIELLNMRVKRLSTEKQQLESQLTILNACKGSVQEKADRILEHDNALNGKFERLKVDFKKQTMTVAGLQDEVYRLQRRIHHLKVENERLTQENDEITRSLMSSERVPRDDKDAEDTKVGRKRPFFSIRGAK